MARFRFRFKARMSLEIDDFRLTASVAVGGSAPDRPRRPAVADDPDLAAELAHYTTPSDLHDLHAVLDRYDDVDTEEIRAVLEEQARHRLFRSRTRSPIG